MTCLKPTTHENRIENKLVCLLTFQCQILKKSRHHKIANKIALKMTLNYVSEKLNLSVKHPEA